MATGYEGYQGYGGYGGGAMDPAAMRTKLAMAMMERGSDSSPIRSPWQGAARMSNALFGALMMRQMQDSQNSSWQKALAGMPTAAGGGLAPGGAPGGFSGGEGSPGLPAQPGALTDLANDPEIMRGVANAATNGLPDSATIGQSLQQGGSPPQMGPMPPAMAPNNAAGGMPPGYIGGGGGHGSMAPNMTAALPASMQHNMMVAGPGAPSLPPSGPASGNGPQGGGAAGAFNPADLAMFQQDMQAAPGTPPGAGGGVLDQLKANIAKTESGGNYGATGPVTGSGDRAFGKYQVMGNNVGPWTQEILGQPMTPQQFLQNPQAQEAVATAKLGQYAQQYGPAGAARAWFTGSPTGKGADVNGMTGDRYAALATQGMGGGGSPPGAPPMAFNGGPPPAGPAAAAIQGAAGPPGGLNGPPASMQPDMMVAGPGVPSGARGGAPPPMPPQPPPDQGGGGNPLSALGNMFGMSNPSGPQGGNGPAPAGGGAGGQAVDPRMRQLMEVISDPYAAPGAKQVAMQFLQYYMPHPSTYQAVPGTNDERQMDWMGRPTGTVLHGGPKTDNLAPGNTLYQTDSSGMNPHAVAGWGVQGQGGGGGGQPAAGGPITGPSNTPRPGESYESFKARQEKQGGNEGALAVPSTEDFAKITTGARGDETYKDADVATGAYNFMARSSALSTHATDKGLIDAYARLMNPGRAVGKGQYQINADIQSMPDEIRGDIMKAWAGEGVLSTQTRAAMLADGRMRAEEYQRQWNTARQGWAATAKHGNIDESAVPNVTDLIDPDWTSINRYTVDPTGRIVDGQAKNNGQGGVVPHEQLQSMPGVPPPASTATPPLTTVKTPADVQGLPKGTRFMIPDGSGRIGVAP